MESFYEIRNRKKGIRKKKVDKFYCAQIISAGQEGYCGHEFPQGVCK